jgi:O-antigen ligase
MISTRPWQGYGLGTYSLVYPEFASFDSGYRIEHAHNDWLEWASEGGVGFLGLWATLVLPVFGRLKASPWGLGIVAVSCHAVVDFPIARFGIAAWFFILLGMIERERWLPGTNFHRRTT